MSPLDIKINIKKINIYHNSIEIICRHGIIIVNVQNNFYLQTKF